MLPDLPPTAEGELGQTPFAHLAVYALDKRISGELFLLTPGEAADAVTDVIRFDNGVPTKARVFDEFSLLGGMLVERGLVEASVLAGALATRGSLLGDMLVLAGGVEPKSIDETLALQLERRVVRCFSRAESVRFKYFDKSDTLASWGGEPLAPNPFRLLWLGIEAHGPCSASMGPTLDQLGDVMLELHPRAPHHRFGFEGAASDVLDVLALEPVPYPELLKLETAPPELVRKVVYALLLTRQLDVGKGGLPVGVEERPATVAKVQLRSSMQRRGVAIDEPGDGERTPIRPISIRRGTSGSIEIIPREEDLASPRSAPRSDDLSTPSAASAPSTSAKETPKQPPPAPKSAPVAVAAKPAERPQAAQSSRPAGSSKAPEPPQEARASTKTREPAEDREEPSQQRFIADALRAMPVAGLMDLALERIDEKDAKGALEVCAVLREKSKASLPDVADAQALTVWAASLKPGADLKVFVLELDDLIHENDRARARHVRGLLRRRLSEDKGALADFKKAMELEPAWERAGREAEAMEKRLEKPAEKGLMKRLFGRS